MIQEKNEKVKTIIMAMAIFLFVMIAVPVHAAWNIWLDHAVKKYRQGGEDGTNGLSSLTIKAAKNEFESFQVLIFADGESLSNVDVSVSNFTKDSATISDIYIYKQYYLNCATASRAEYNTGYYPDALIPKVDRYYGETRNAFPFSVSSGNVQGVWVDVGTESSAVPGTYTSTVTVSADGKSNETLTIPLVVWNFALPSTSAFKSVFYFQPGYVSYAHMGTLYNNAANDTLTPLYFKGLLYHRISPTMHGEWKGQSYTWNSGTDTMSSFSPGSRWLQYMPDMLDGTSITSGPYAGAKVTATTIGYGDTENDHNIADDEKSTAFQQYTQAWYDYFVSQGWDADDLLFFTTPDEPSGANLTWRREGDDTATDYQACIDIANDAAATDLGADNVFVNAHNKTGLSSFAGFYDPLIGHFGPDYWEKENSSSTYIYPHSGYPSADHYWAYMSCMNNSCAGTGTGWWSGQIDIESIDAPAMYNRMWSFLYHKYSLTGILYYFVNAGFYHNTHDPWYNPWQGDPGAPNANGSGTLFYPGVAGEIGGTPAGAHTPNIGGTHDIPIESIRLKLIRDAIEDMDYMILADSYGKSIDSYVNSMFSQTADINLIYWDMMTDTDTLFTARENIAMFISISDSERLNAPANLRIVEP